MENSFLPEDLRHNVEHRMFNIIKIKKVVSYVIGLIIFFLMVFFLFFNAPADFVSGTVVRIEQGASLRNVSLQLKEDHVIRSRLVFEAFVIIYGGEKHIMYSDYLFENKLPVWQIAKRISKGEHRTAPIVITIPEGFDTVQIANTFASKLSNFNKNKFLLEATKLEGYLFPDTYFFFSTANEKDVLKSMSENFEKKIEPFRLLIKISGETEKDIIIIASLIEREAKGDTDRGFISGILWKRLAIGMPLQVDAAPGTYKVKGLPKNPIANPGLQAIKSAINPLKSPYLYYLHDKNGVVHYARTFLEHKQNVLKYLTR